MSRNNPNAFPAGVLPGFDPSHVGAKGQLRFSGISMGSNFLSLNPFKTGTKTSTPTAKIVGPLVGPATNFGTAVATSFSGMPAVADSNQTFAAIVQFDSASLANLAGIASTNGSADNGYEFFKDSTDVLMVRIGSANVVTNIALAANIPYFVIITATSAVSLSGLVKRLDTGTIVTDINRSTASSAGTATDGTYIVGNWRALNLGLNGSLAALMISSARLSAQEMLKWAEDPWTFWYPDPNDNLVGVVAAGGFSPWWAANNNRPVLGTGTH